jgi:hypothetical protein
MIDACMLTWCLAGVDEWMVAIFGLKQGIFHNSRQNHVHLRLNVYDHFGGSC